MRRMAFVFLLTAALPSFLLAQPKWKKSRPGTVPDLALFHSTRTANFPTTETLGKGDFEFEISHRFQPSIKDGFDASFGFDGPAKIRYALSFGVLEHLMITLGRSNIIDNWDLQVKYKLFQFRNPALPVVVALQGGAALNTEVPRGLNRSRTDPDNFQYYGQLIINTMLLNKKLGVGIVPSFLYNSVIFSLEKQHTFTLGQYLQYYINKKYSLWVEYNPIIAGYQGIIQLGEAGRSHNSVAIGFDVETGGHFFHIFVTNNVRLNPSQYLVGADRSFNDGELRFAFGITRYL